MGIDKGTISRNFSKHAYSYDKYAGIQKRTASSLLDLLEKDNINNVLFGFDKPVLQESTGRENRF